MGAVHLKQHLCWVCSDWSTWPTSLFYSEVPATKKSTSLLNYTMKMVWYKDCALLCSKLGSKLDLLLSTSYSCGENEFNRNLLSLFQWRSATAKPVLGSGKLLTEQGKGGTTKISCLKKITEHTHTVEWFRKVLICLCNLQKKKKKRKRLVLWIVAVIKLCHHCSFYITSIVLCRKKKTHIPFVARRTQLIFVSWNKQTKKQHIGEHQGV